MGLLSGLVKATVGAVSIPLGAAADVIDSAMGNHQNGSKLAKAIETTAEGLGETTDGEII